jgi:acyl-CoA synthetase (AMP-forming)/AMP-acid ligase II/acyl carrier protein
MTQVKFKSIIDVLESNYAKLPDRHLFNYVKNDVVKRVNYETLYEGSIKVASFLQSKFQTGDRVILMFSTEPEFAFSLFGTLMAGMIAVPTHVPKKNVLSERVDLIIEDSQAKIIITTRKIKDYLFKNFANLFEDGKMEVCVSDDLPRHNIPIRHVNLNENDVAFLQYTSGSTGDPKGVMVSHGNLMANLADLYQGANQTPDSIMLSWLPAFHDLGLISAIFLPLYGNFVCYLIPPVEFMTDPLKWIILLSKFKATHTVAPNFAFDLCVSHFDASKLTSVDLRSVKYMGNCAEPVRYKTLTSFEQLYAPYNLKNVIRPGYGLAEATLKVTSVPANQHLPAYVQYINGKYTTLNNRVLDKLNEAKVYVGCGSSAIDTEVVIVDNQTNTILPDGQEGEIWVHGATVALGYWNKALYSKEIFGAKLAGNNEKCFLRTGDKGFLCDGNLFVSGRIKDMIIIRGVNYYPQDIELTIENAHSSIKPGNVVAFASDGQDAENLVLIAEIKRDQLNNFNPQSVFNAIVKGVEHEHKIEVAKIVLIQPSTIPKTSSGKIRRAACKDLYKKGALTELANWVCETRKFEVAKTANTQGFKVSDHVISVLKNTLNIKELSLYDDVYMLGIDSITSVKIIHQLEAALNITIPPPLILTSANIGEFIAQLEKTIAARDSHSTAKGSDNAANMVTADDLVFGNELNMIDDLSEQELDEFIKSLTV